MKKSSYIFLFFLACAMFSCLFPYPAFSSHVNITNNEVFSINNYRETELTNIASEQLKIVGFAFPQMDIILPIGTQFEIIDLESKLSFCAERTGGKNHVDIEPIDNQNCQILSKIGNFSWERRPVLVKLNELTYVPASLSLYPHGYNTKNMTLNGHLCLHFYNSLTDGTKQIDEEHQKCVKKAEKLGKEYLKEII